MRRCTQKRQKKTFPFLTMFQINFSDQSLSEFHKLDFKQQLALIDKISTIHPEQLVKTTRQIGRFRRNNKTFYRLRIDNYRLYFEQQGHTLYNHCILHNHTLIDFIFRSKLLPVSKEQIEQNPSFWGYFESLKQSIKRISQPISTEVQDVPKNI